MSSEAKLRQSHQELSSQLAQKDQQVLQLQAQLQQQQQEQIQQQQQAQHTVLYPSPNRQTNFKVSTLPSVILAHCNSRFRSSLMSVLLQKLLNFEMNLCGYVQQNIYDYDALHNLYFLSI